MSEISIPNHGMTLLRAYRFMDSRPSAAVLCQGPDTGFKPGWFPRLARQFVRNMDDPQFGYPSREDALAAAKRFRQSCREFINGDSIVVKAEAG